MTHEDETNIDWVKWAYAREQSYGDEVKESSEEWQREDNAKIILYHKSLVENSRKIKSKSREEALKWATEQLARLCPNNKIRNHNIEKQRFAISVAPDWLPESGRLQDCGAKLVFDKNGRVIEYKNEIGDTEFTKWTGDGYIKQLRVISGGYQRITKIDYSRNPFDRRIVKITTRENNKPAVATNY